MEKYIGEIFKGRPTNLENRSKVEIDCYDILDQLNIEYEGIDHYPIFDMEELKIVRDKLGISVNKNLFLSNSQGTKFYLLLMPGDKPFKTKELSKQINSARLSFGKEDKLNDILHVTSGSVNILSLMYDIENQVQLLIDEDLLKNDFMGMHPMMNTTSLKIKKDDIVGKFLDHVHHNYISVKLLGY